MHARALAASVPNPGQRCSVLIRIDVRRTRRYRTCGKFRPSSAHWKDELRSRESGSARKGDARRRRTPPSPPIANNQLINNQRAGIAHTRCRKFRAAVKRPRASGSHARGRVCLRRRGAERSWPHRRWLLFFVFHRPLGVGQNLVGHQLRNDVVVVHLHPIAALALSHRGQVGAVGQHLGHGNLSLDHRRAAL